MNFSCPAPSRSTDRVTLAHGGGGRLTRELVEQIILPAMGQTAERAEGDGADISGAGDRLAFSADGHVISPLFFPGGDIGSLAVFGTTNDLAMCGAQPLHLAMCWILEEGLPMEIVQRIAVSIGESARLCGVEVVTGDTKVVDKGKGDGLYLASSGVGKIELAQTPSPKRIWPGDQVILSGDVGRHSIAVLSVRQGLEFEMTIRSDCAPLANPVLSLIRAGVNIHCLRDLTRGGLATALLEIASASKKGIVFGEKAIPVHPEVEAVCELLGLNPLYAACEGRFICILPATETSRALDILRGNETTRSACVIGEVTEENAGEVRMETVTGIERTLDWLSGEQLPRIC